MLLLIPQAGVQAWPLHLFLEAWPSDVLLTTILMSLFYLVDCFFNGCGGLTKGQFGSLLQLSQGGSGIGRPT